MRRIRLALVLVVLFQAIAPASAHALSWWWLETLSGPQFGGPVFQVRAVCWKQGESKPVPVRLGVIFSLCKLERTERRRASVDVNLGLLRSHPNPLFADGERIDLKMLSASFSAHIAGPLEFGFGIGNSWFSGDAIDPFTKVIIEPLRLDIRPFHTSDAEWRSGKDPWYREVFIVRAGFVIFPKGFASAELKGERLPAEWVFYKGIFIDGEPILRKMLGKW